MATRQDQMGILVLQALLLWKKRVLNQVLSVLHSHGRPKPNIIEARANKPDVKADLNMNKTVRLNCWRMNLTAVITSF